VREDLHSAGAAPAVEVVAVSQFLGERGGWGASVADLLGVFAVVLVLGYDGSGGGCWGRSLGNDLRLLLLVNTLLLVGALDLLLLLGWLEALIVVRNVQRLEWIRHIK
jgi:hypothetical protein